MSRCHAEKQETFSSVLEESFAYEKYSIYECTVAINKYARVKKVTAVNNLWTLTSSCAQTL